ncbi:unnamed protein product [Ixodes hexagonus]
MPKVTSLVSEIMGDTNISTSCSAGLFKTFLALKNKEPWAIRMALSNGLLPRNMLEGSLTSIGSYTQCLKTRVYSSEGGIQFRGQYCSMFLRPPNETVKSFVEMFHAVGELTVTPNPGRGGGVPGHERSWGGAIRLGTCTPSTCSTDEISFLANGVLGMYGVNATVKGCRTNDPKRMTFLQLVSISCLGTLGGLVLAATLLEWILGTRSDVRSPHGGAFFRTLKIVLIFSAINNTRRLLRTQARAENRPILFLSGSKVLLILWVIYGHTYVIAQPEFISKFIYSLSAQQKLLFQVVVNALLSVSTFLFLSGFVMSFLMLGQRDLLTKRNLIPVYVIGSVRRYFRLTLPIVVVVLAAFLLPLLADGPADQELMAEQVSSCAARWWTVLLHYNNFSAMHEMCLLHLWYVSTDVQIFMVVAFPITLLLTRFPKFALLVSGIVTLGFSIVTSLHTHFWHLLYSATSGTNDGLRILETLRYIYFRPFAHVGTYVVGVVTGYVTAHAFVNVDTFCSLLLLKIIQAALWVVSLGLTTSVMFITLSWNRGRLPNDIANSLYGGFHRLVWSLGFSWPAYACATGRGGIVNGFLSWTAFMPLSRLTYCIYLVHLLFILLRVGSMKTHTYTAEYFQVITALGVFCISVFFAYLLHLCCEAPVLQIEKLIFDKPMEALTKDKKPPAVPEVFEKSKL